MRRRDAARNAWRGRRRGWSLVELVVVLAIVALLAAVAWPAYADHVTRARRLRAQLDLMEATQFLQRQWAARGSFRDLVLPDLLSQSPHDGVPAYRIRLEVDPQGTGYVLTAEPERAPGDDLCGVLTLDSTGRKGSAGPFSECWRQ